MKLSDLENANKAQRILKQLDKNIKIADAYLNMKHNPDCGGIKGLYEYGYACHVSYFSDSSGKHVLDLDGCYVGLEVYRATLGILLQQNAYVVKYLESIGVEVDKNE
jgi:hypothetical protein